MTRKLFSIYLQHNTELFPMQDKSSKYFHLCLQIPIPVPAPFSFGLLLREVLSAGCCFRLCLQHITSAGSHHWTVSRKAVSDSCINQNDIRNYNDVRFQTSVTASYILTSFQPLIHIPVPELSPVFLSLSFTPQHRSVPPRRSARQDRSV